MSIFDRRREFKPFEYPEFEAYKKAITRSYWTVDEWSFEADVQDFHVRLSAVERSAVRNALLAISQVEVDVKRFWGRIGEAFPKPEVEQVGFTFAESEVRHSDAYSHLLEVLGLNADFAVVLGVPAIRRRVEVLGRHLAAPPATPAAALFRVALFAIFVENVSLFGQFLVVKAFNKHRNVLKDVDNVVQATQKEENVHALFGAELVNVARREHPELFGPAFYDALELACVEACGVEAAIVDWIFEAGEVDFLPTAAIKEFIRDRFNRGMEMIGGRGPFRVDRGFLDVVRWFDEESHAEVATDFFHKRPVAYAKRTQPITAGDLF